MVPEVFFLVHGSWNCVKDPLRASARKSNLASEAREMVSLIHLAGKNPGMALSPSVIRESFC